MTVEELQKENEFLKARLIERTEFSMETACRDTETIRKLRNALKLIANGGHPPHICFRRDSVLMEELAMSALQKTVDL